MVLSESAAALIYCPSELLRVGRQLFFQIELAAYKQFIC